MVEADDPGMTAAIQKARKTLPAFLALARGWALAAQGQHAEGIAELRQGLAARRTMGARLSLAEYSARLGEAYGRTGQVEEGLRLLAEASALVDCTGERY